MRLRAIKEVYYATKTYKPGDEFEAAGSLTENQSDAFFLIGFGKCEDATASVAVVKTEPVKATVEATADVKAEEERPIVDGRRREYRRRDLKAGE